ncbi:MAG: hypothetical protein K2N90_06880 [Lachnospiraceae bacterium]|nr:hypothetical protein [Lachnospiraceae bacterium]
MEENLQIVLKEYIRDVENVCKILIKDINDSESLALKNKYDFFLYRSNCKKMEFEAKGIRYRLHGKGCMAFNKEMFIDWDFGYRSRWCGIDPWKVSITLEKNNSPHMEYFNGDFIQTACEQLVENGIMFKRNNQYYFAMAADETFKPEFPAEYDTLIVESSNLSWSIPRSKVIDRFIRKSTQVHNQINDMEDKYLLKFLLGDKEVYSIPYNDICYSENAVKIMSDEIIKNILKEQSVCEKKNRMKK